MYKSEVIYLHVQIRSNLFTCTNQNGHLHDHDLIELQGVIANPFYIAGFIESLIGTWCPHSGWLKLVPFTKVISGLFSLGYRLLRRAVCLDFTLKSMK